MFNRKCLVYFLLSLLFLSLIIDFSVGFRIAVSGPVEAGTGWLEGWQYRKSHVINPASGAGTNYPIKIVVHYGSGTDSGENVYLNSHCRADFGDIRFTASDGETLLDYWIEEKVDSDYAVFWVEIADNLSSSSVTIYIYYGKSDATTTSDGLGLDLWQLREYDYSSGAYPKIFFKKPGSSTLRIESPGEGPIYSRGYAFIHAKKSYLHGKKLGVRWRAYQSGYGYEYVGFVYIVDHAHFRKKTTDEFKDNDDKEHPITDYTRFCALSIKAPGGWSSWKTSTSSTLDLSSFSSDYVTILIRLKDSWYDVSSKLDIDYLQILDSSDNPLKTFHFTYSVVMEQTGTYRDYGLYRKFVDPEPSHGGWGNEEQPNQPPNPPTLNSPQANERFDPTTSVTFAWTFNDPDAGDAQSAYRFQLDDDSDFSSPIIVDTGKVSSSTSSTTQTLPSTVGLYYWRVKTWDSYDAEGEWSEARQIIVDRIKIISGGVVNLTIDVDVGGKIWYYAVYEYDNSTFDDSCGVLYLNGFEMTWDGEKWIYAFPYSTESNQMTFHITGVLDNQYGLTEINNQVGDITINWATMTIEIKKG